MNPVIEAILFVFNPYRCVFCGTVCKTGVTVCEECGSKLVPAPKFCLPPSSVNRDLLCCMAPFPYRDELVRKGLLNFKFHNQQHSYHVFSKAMADMDYAGTEIADFITSVPLHKIHKRCRGYNQSELLAREYASLLGKPYVETLVKHADNKTQSTLQSDSDRLKNVKDCYCIIDESLVKDKTIIIVDDVYTSGATMKECARVLKRAGAKMVMGAAVCYAE